MSAACSKCGKKAQHSRGLCVNCYENRRRRDTFYGRWQSTHLDVDPTRQHLALLRAAGVGTRRVAELAGLPIRTVRELYRNPNREFVTKGTAKAILGVPLPSGQLDPLRADGSFIPALGSMRRLQALIAAGYTNTQLGDQTGLNSPNLNKVISGRQRKITVGKARAIAAAFDRLQMTPGPDLRSRLRGQRNGWALPLMWDENAIDDPAGQPDSGPEVVVAFAERYAELRSCGLSDEQIAQRLGVKEASLQRKIERHELRSAS